MIGEGRRPRAGSALRAFAVTAGFALVAAAATLATGGNYLFLRRKPAGGSLLDAMGPWPLYIAAAAALGLVAVPGARGRGAALSCAPMRRALLHPGRRAAGRDARR